MEKREARAWKGWVGSLNACNFSTMDLSLGRNNGEEGKRKYPSNERSNGNTIPWTKERGGGGRKDVKRVVCPEKTRLFIIETSRRGIYLTEILRKVGSSEILSHFLSAFFFFIRRTKKKNGCKKIVRDFRTEQRKLVFFLWNNFLQRLVRGPNERMNWE